MKRKNEEQLIELAFGDMTAGEAERLREEIAADPKASDTLRSYEELRLSLGGLRDVPEMQLSRERLRDAILAGGLKESRPWKFQWLGAPVAIAAVAFAFTLVARRPALPLPAGQGLVATQGANDVEIGNFDPTIERIAVTPSSMFGDEKLGRVTFESTTPKIPEKRVRVASASKPTGPEATIIEKPTSAAPGATTSEIAPPVLAATSEPALDAATLVEDTEVIVLSTEMNLGNGAQRATSMESASNVLIGG